jgi:hypothetical protein
MPDSFLDHLPGHEQRKLRKMMSAAAYEKLREKVKGPEDLERELQRAERMAELRFEMASRPEFHARLKETVDADVREQGIDEIFEKEHLDADARKAIEQGKFALTVVAHPSTHEDALVAIPEGAVQETLPVRQGVTDRYAGRLRSDPGSFAYV